jgi:hypothetical protein
MGYIIALLITLGFFTSDEFEKPTKGGSPDKGPRVEKILITDMDGL